MGTRWARLAHGETALGSRRGTLLSWGRIPCARKILDLPAVGTDTGWMASDGKTAAEIGRGLVDWLSDGEADGPAGQAGGGSADPTGLAAPTDRSAATDLAAPAPTDPTGGRVELTGSLADTILRGIDGSHPEGVEGWIASIAMDPDQRARLLPTINKILGMDAGQGSTNNFNFYVTAQDKPVIDVTPDDLKSFAEDLKTEARG